MSKKKFDPTDTKAMTDELDQSGFFRPQPLPHASIPTTPPAANAEMQESVIADLQNSANEEMQKSANAELQKVEIQRAALRKTYDKTSYRLCPEAFDAIETAKRLLRRKYDIKASLEDIAEIALIMAQEDLEKNEDKSELVKRLSAILQKQK